MAEAFLVKGAFLLFALATIGGGVFLFFTKNILHGAYGLLLSLLSLSGIYVLAGADFIAVSQLIIYVGGILVLLIFGIMLSAKKGDRKLALAVENINSLASLLLGILVATALIFITMKLRLNAVTDSELYTETVGPLGMGLMTNYVLILEIIGFLLLIALIGATYIAQKEKV